MTKRMIRYSTINEAIEQEALIKQTSNCSIVLKSGKVYTGRVLELNDRSIIFENMRRKKQEISTNELSELIIDVKSD